MLKYLHKLKSKKGFTMVELLISIGIFAILLAVMSSLIRPVNKIITETRRDARMDNAVETIGHYIKKSTDVASRVEVFDRNAFTTGGAGSAFADTDEADAFLANFSHCQRHSYTQYNCAVVTCAPACLSPSFHACVPCPNLSACTLTCATGHCPPLPSALNDPFLCTISTHSPCVDAECTATKEHELFALYLDEDGALYDFGRVEGLDFAALSTLIINAATNGTNVFTPFYYNRCTIDYAFQTLPSGGLKIDINVLRNDNPVTRGRSTNFNYLSPFIDSVTFHLDSVITPPVDEIRNIPANGDPPRGILILYTKVDS